MLMRMLVHRYKWLVFAALVQNLMCSLTGLAFLLISLVVLGSYPEMELFFSTASAAALFITTVAMLGWGLFGVVSVWRARYENGSLLLLLVFVVVLVVAVCAQLFMVGILVAWIVDGSSDVDAVGAGAAEPVETKVCLRVSISSAKISKPNFKPLLPNKK